MLHIPDSAVGVEGSPRTSVSHHDRVLAGRAPRPSLEHPMMRRGWLPAVPSPPPRSPQPGGPALTARARRRPGPRPRPRARRRTPRCRCRTP